MQPMASETLMQSLELKLVVNTKKKLIYQEKLERFLFLNGSELLSSILIATIIGWKCYWWKWCGNIILYV